MAAAPAERLTFGPGMHQQGRWSADASSLIVRGGGTQLRRLAAAARSATRAQHADPEAAHRSAHRGSEPIGHLERDNCRLCEPPIDQLVVADDRHGVRHRTHRAVESDTHGDRPRSPATAAASSFTSADYDLMSIPATGGAAEKLCEKCGVVMGASTDGRLTVYEPLENEDVLMYDAAAHETVTLATRPGADMILSSTRLSPRRQVGRVPCASQRHQHRADLDCAGRAGAARAASHLDSRHAGDALERDPAWSPDGRFLYFISERDGFRCVWARPLDAATKRPIGDAFAVRHFHAARFSLKQVGKPRLSDGPLGGRGRAAVCDGRAQGQCLAGARVRR